MSPASTGSVGESIAPSSSAAPSDRPMTWVPYSATPAIVSGIASTSSRVTDPHSRQRSGRSSFSPDENSAKINATSAMCSITFASPNGSSHSTSKSWIASAATAAEPEVDQRRREGALVLVRHRPDGCEDGEADEQQPDRERVREREAGVGGEREPDHADTTGAPAYGLRAQPSSGDGTDGPSGAGGNGSSGSGADGPSGMSGTAGPGSGTAGWVGVSGTIGPVGSCGRGSRARRRS